MIQSPGNCSTIGLGVDENLRVEYSLCGTSEVINRVATPEARSQGHSLLRDSLVGDLRALPKSAWNLGIALIFRRDEDGHSISHVADTQAYFIGDQASHCHATWRGLIGGGAIQRYVVVPRGNVSPTQGQPCSRVGSPKGEEKLARGSATWRALIHSIALYVCASFLALVPVQLQASRELLHRFVAIVGPISM